MKTIILYLLLSSIFCFQTVNSKEIKIFEFTQEELKILKVHSFKKKTTYTLGSNENGNYLKAEANAQASGLGIDKKINLNETPFINITWKVEKDLSGINEKSKKGHDYAARVFVIKELGKLPWQKRVMNYVYSSNESIGDHWRSPYTKQSYDYVLSTIKEANNEWILVKANVKDHFKKYHGIDVEEVDGVAIMTDTDNSKRHAIAYYQNIFFSSE